jgi:hypothetical protein
MRNDFKIALSAHPGGFVDRVVRQFGTVSELDAQGWPADSEVVVFECSYTDGSQHVDDWRSVLDQGKTLGLIGLQAEDRALLQQVVGRSFKASIINLFIRTSHTRKDHFTYTIVPDFKDPSDLDPAEVAEFLSKRVFTLESGGPSPSLPPELTNNIWPAGYELYGSVQPMISNILFLIDLPEGYGFPPTQSATLNAQGYFFWGNGIQNGDGRYHAIIISRINWVNPIESVSGPLNNYLFGYSLQISARAGGVELQYPQVRANSTQPRMANWPSIPGLNLGSFICTRFGYNPSVQIYTQAAPPPPSPMKKDYLLLPNYQQYVNQVSAPGIEYLYINPIDTLNTSCVQFSHWSDGWTSSNPDPSIQPQPGTSGTDEIVVVSYLDFAPAGSDSYEVEFVFQINLAAEWDPVSGENQLFESAGIVSVPIDLVKATRFSGASKADL